MGEFRSRWLEKPAGAPNMAPTKPTKVPPPGTSGSFVGAVSSPSRQNPPDLDRETRAAMEELARRGYCAVRSSTLGGEVILFEARPGAAKAAPLEHRGAVVYTIDELRELVKMRDAAGLKTLHQAKRFFQGRIAHEEADEA